MWDRRVVEKIEECMERYAVLVLCEIHMIILFRRMGGGIYKPNYDGEWRFLWDELIGDAMVI